jgi:hypothetical protein
VYVCIKDSNSLLFEFIQGGMFIVFEKCSRGYVYSRGYDYSGLYTVQYAEAGCY